MSKEEKAGPEIFGSDENRFSWNWNQENPVEIILVAFILILFFAVPRFGCGIDKTDGMRIPTEFDKSASER